MDSGIFLDEDDLIVSNNVVDVFDNGIIWFSFLFE